MTDDTGGSRSWTLPVVSAAQLLVVLDGTIVNIALPSAQRALGMSDGSRQWTVTAYALAFGGLLLIGGRVSGALGHRRAFMIGLAGFAAASALAGTSVSPAMLFTTRALQGAFAALLAPAGLSLLSTTFTEPRERGRAFGVFAAVGAAGAAVGLIVGGLLTEYAGWRWCLYINVPIALLALVGGIVVPRDLGSRTRLDVAGAVLSAGAFTAVVYGFNQAESLGWGSPRVLLLLVAGAALLAGFVAVEARVPHPLLPMRIVMDRVRAGALLGVALMFLAMFGFYLFVSYYTQTVLGYTPVQAGLALLVNAMAALAGSMLVTRRMAASRLIVGGLLTAAVGMFVLSRVTVHSDAVLVLYLLPALALTGLGLGCVMPPTASLATSNLPSNDIGAASATYNAAQQLGAALGTALLNTVAAGATEPVLGYTTALTVAVLILVAAAVLAAATTTSRRPTHEGAPVA
ncbi:MFS transporter [Pseudonocardia spinosispora]|uniref:MFS transporter n=1 Tax=Pseudonocardia spinosispora TaxID=103441 RepID=UPI00040CFD22|nr:MFS transporter [Pseudonocardia spinosispora]